MAIKVLQNTDFAVSHSDAVKVRGENKTLTQKMDDIPEIDSTDTSNLDVADDDGNVVVRFSEGHIKTQNFDSRDVESIKQNIGADNFDAEKRYEIGNVVKYKGKFYKFVNAHLGAWVSTDVEDTDIANEISSGNENGIKVTDADAKRLDFSDENDNVLVRFEAGHIRTKYFDSLIVMDKLQRLLRIDKFKGKTIGIVGDSISTFQGWLPSNVSGYDGERTYAYWYPHSNPSSDVDSVDKTWWYKMAIALGMDPKTQISNCSWSGSRVSCGQYNINSASTTDASPACSTRRISDLTLRLGGNAPDIVICFISCNDWGNSVPVGTWQISDAVPEDGVIGNMRAAYALMLHKLHTTYPHARIFCCTNLDDYNRDSISGWPSDHGGVTTEQWNQNIKEIASAFGCELIDLHSCGMNYSNLSLYCSDGGLHPNAAGHELIANKVISELLSKY